MIFRQLKFQPIKMGELLKDCVGNDKISHNSLRHKSIFQWYNQLWEKFDDRKLTPPYNHCTQVGKSRIVLL